MQTALPPTIASAKPRRPSKVSKTAYQQAYYSIVLSAAETAINILHGHNISSAVFGSLACKLYVKRNARFPKVTNPSVTTCGAGPFYI